MFRRGDGTDQDFLSGFVLVLYLSAQVSLGNLQVLSHLPAVLEQGQVAILDPNQLGEGTRQKRVSGNGIFYSFCSFVSL